MANVCWFQMRIVGGKDEVQELADMMARKNGLMGFPGVDSFEVTPERPLNQTWANDVWELTGQGDCDASILCGMRNRDSFVSLESETERLHLAVEAFSMETGLEFQEHVVIVNGEVLKEEVLDYKEILIDGRTEDEYRDECIENGIDPKEAPSLMNCNGDIEIGGFGDEWLEYGKTDRLLRDMTYLRDMSALRDPNEVQVCRQDDGSVSFFFGNTAINGNVVLKGAGFKLEDLSGDQVACGSWNDLEPEELKLYALFVERYVPASMVQEELNRKPSLEGQISTAEEKKQEQSQSAKKPKSRENER